MFVIFLLPQDVMAAEKTEINTLINQAKEMDGETVKVVGEAIGEPMNRGTYTWVNINDGTNAIGVWMKKSDAKKITYYGDYKNKGDMLQLTGIFNRACSQHGGEADIHFKTFDGIEKGQKIKIKILPIRVMLAGVLISITLASAWIYKRKKEKEL